MLSRLLCILMLHSTVLYVGMLSSGSSISSIPLHFETTPEFSGAIQNITIPVGREAVLSCSVTDLGHYKVGWMKADDQTILSLHTRVITHNSRISVTHDDEHRTWQLRIRPLKESDRGCYMCQINTSAMKKQLGCVDVQVPPDIDDAKTSSDVTVTEGENITLSCRATGHPPPRILWRREDGDHLLLRPQLWRKVDKVDSFTGSELTLASVDRRHMGAYLCIASNDVPPAVSKRITLNVNFAPFVQIPKAQIGAPLGGNAKLKCDIEGYPKSSNFWVNNQDTILLNSHKHTIQEKRSGYKIILILTVHNISRLDFGVYKCVASNSFGKGNGTVRIYEIRVTTTTTTTTQATTEITTSLQTTVNALTSSDLTLVDSTEPIQHELSRNWLFPSVVPAPLEFETHSSSASALFSKFNGVLMALILLR